MASREEYGRGGVAPRFRGRVGGIRCGKQSRQCGTPLRDGRFCERIARRGAGAHAQRLRGIRGRRGRSGGGSSWRRSRWMEQQFGHFVDCTVRLKCQQRCLFTRSATLSASSVSAVSASLCLCVSVSQGVGAAVRQEALVSAVESTVGGATSSVEKRIGRADKSSAAAAQAMQDSAAALRAMRKELEALSAAVQEMSKPQ